MKKQTKLFVVNDLCQQVNAELAARALPEYHRSYTHFLMVCSRDWYTDIVEAKHCTTRGQPLPRLVLGAGGDTFAKLLSSSPRFDHLRIIPDPEKDRRSGAEGCVSGTILNREGVEKLSLEQKIELLLKDDECLQESTYSLEAHDLQAQRAYYEILLKYFDAAAKQAKRIKSPAARTFAEACWYLTPQKPLPDKEVYLPEECVIEAERLALRAQRELWMDNHLHGLR